MGTDSVIHTGKQDDLIQEQEYKFGRITFVVEPRFKEDAKETFGSILLKLMKSEVAT